MRRIIGTAVVMAVSMGSASGVALADPAVPMADRPYSVAVSGQGQDKAEGLTLFLERISSVPDSVLRQGIQLHGTGWRCTILKLRVSPGPALLVAWERLVSRSAVLWFLLRRF